MSEEAKRQVIRTLRWVARVLALLVSLPFLYFLFFRSGEVLPRLSWSAPNEMPLFLAWLVVVAGILISWRWELVGGLMTAGAAILVGILGYAGCGADEVTTCLVVAVPYFLSGALLLGCCWGKERPQSPDANRRPAT